MLERDPGSRDSRLLKLGDQPGPTRVAVCDRFYSVGTDTLIEAVRELPGDCALALLIGHAPAARGLGYEMTDPNTSRPGAVDAIEGRFPAGVSQLEFEWGLVGS